MKKHKESILKHFTCQKTGNCCRTAGTVYVTDDNIKQMASQLKLPIFEFKQKFTLRKNGWQIIADTRFRPNCFLNKDNYCDVYESRPHKCKTYPNWPEIWENKTSFLKEIKLDAELSFNTNGTKLLDSTLALLENRPNLIINISLDGIGEHNNYIRSGSKWQDIENNVKRFKQKNIKILFYYILQHTSLFTFQPVYEYCVKNNIELGIGEIYSGSVDGSGHLTLNSASKNDVDSFKKWLY